MKIDDPILQQAKTFQGFLPIVEQAEPRLSYLGIRSIYLNNAKKELHIDSLARRMIHLIGENLNFSESERPLIKKISKCIEKIYKTNDEQVAQSFFFLRFIVWIRDIFNSQFPYHKFSSVRWSWRECKAWSMIGKYHMSSLYTKEQYQRTFNSMPDSELSDSNYGDIPLWLSPHIKKFSFKD